MKNLFISDLDGTLLNANATLSAYARKSIKQIIDAGIDFTIATARSVHSAQEILAGVELTLPIIEFNGAYISDLKSGEHLQINSIASEICEQITNNLSQKNISYLISSFDGAKDNLYYVKVTNTGMRWYVNERKKNRDPRLQQIKNIREISREEIVCLTLIDEYQNLVGEYKKLKEMAAIEVHFQENFYSPGWYWLTIHSAEATKDKAIQELVKLKNLTPRLITVFGDETNDIKMMKFADCGIAVANAKPEVKAIADKIIPSNLEDGVIKYIFEEMGLK